MRESSRWAWAEIDLDAVAHNVGVLRAVVAPAGVWAVVKADGYGHGAIAVARAALAAGAGGLCVALAAEGVALREAGIDGADPRAQRAARRGAPASSVAPPPHADRRRPPPASTPSPPRRIGARRRRSASTSRSTPACTASGPDPRDAAALAERIEATGCLHLAGVFTHLAVADEVGRPETAAALAGSTRRGLALPPVDIVHAANSAGALAHPAARYSFVRAGIAVYGISPGPERRRRRAGGCGRC